MGEDAAHVGDGLPTPTATEASLSGVLGAGEPGHGLLDMATPPTGIEAPPPRELLSVANVPEARVVGGERERGAVGGAHVPEPPMEPREVAQPGLRALPRVGPVPHAELGRGRRHELEQADRAPIAPSPGVEAALDASHGHAEPPVQAVGPRGPPDRGVVGAQARRPEPDPPEPWADAGGPRGVLHEAADRMDVGVRRPLPVRQDGGERPGRDQADPSRARDLSEPHVAGIGDGSSPLGSGVGAVASGDVGVTRLYRPDARRIRSAHESDVMVGICASWLVAAAVAAPLGPDDPAALRALAGLAAEDPATIARGAEAAAALGHVVFLDPLRAALAHPDAEVRRAAVRGLGAIGVPRTSRDLWQLQDALGTASRDRSEDVATAAVRALLRFPFPEVRRALERLAAEAETRPGVRRAVLEGLRRPPDADAIALGQAWLRLAAEEADRAAAGAATTAPLPPAELRWEASGLVLAARDLLDPDEGNHREAVERVAAWPDAAARTPFLVRALREPAAIARRPAVQALASHPELPGVEPALVRALSDADVESRRLALDGLEPRRTPVVTEALTARLAAEPDAGLRARMVAVLVTHPPAALASAVAGWAPELVERSGLVLLSAVTRTSTTPEPGAPPETAPRHRLAAALAPTWARWLAGRSPGALGAALRSALDETPDAVAVPALLGTLEAGPTSATHAPLAALAHRRDPRIAPALLALLGSGRADSGVLDAALGREEPELRAGLLALCEDERPQVAALGVAAARRLPPGPDTVQALAARLERAPDDEAAVRLLGALPPELALEAWLDGLAEPRLQRWHRPLLEAVGPTVDPRVAMPAAAAARADPSLAGPVIELLRRQSGETALPALAEIADRGDQDPELRVAAVQAIAERGDAAEPVLRGLAADPEVAVKIAARNALHALRPSVYPEWDPYGRLPLIAEASGFGAATMILAADIAGAELSRAFTGGVGLVLGGATTYLLTLGEEVTLGDAGYFGSLGLWGSLGGWGLGGTLGLDATGTRWATLGGQTLGVAVGALTMYGAEWSLDDVALANFSAAEASFAAVALSSLLLDETRPDKARRVAAAGLLAGAAMTAPMAIFARHLEVEGRAGPVVASMAHGAWLGAFLPGLLSGDLGGGEVFAGAVAGQAIGYFGGLAWTQFGAPSTAALGWSGAGAAAGSAVGLGLGLSLGTPDTRRSAGLLQLGAVTGALGLGLTGERLELHDNDAWIVALTTAGGLFAGGRFSVRAAEGGFDEPSFPGGLLLGAGLGFAGGLGLSQLVDVSDAALVRILLGGALLGLGGQGLSAAIDADVRAGSTITGLGVVLGLALTAPFAESIELGPRDHVGIAMGAGLGALWGGFASGYADADGDGAGRVLGGAAFGAALGTAAGVAIGQATSLRPSALYGAGLGGFAGSSAGAGLGLLLPSVGRAGTRALLHGVGAAGLAGGILAATAGHGRGGDRSARLTHSGVFSGLGALQGALLPGTLYADPRAEQTGGGILLGLGVGAGAGVGFAALAREDSLDPGDLAEVAFATLAADALGAGIGLAAGEGRLASGLALGLGTSAWLAAVPLARHTRYRAEDAGSFAVDMLGLGLAGGMLPAAFERAPSGGAVFGGVLAGAGLGALLAGVDSQLRPDRSDGETAAGGAAGAAIGAGLGLLANGLDPRAGWALAAGGTLGGLATAVAVDARTTYDAPDRALAGLGLLGGAWHGGWLPATLGRQDRGPRALAGGSLLGAGLGLAAAMTASQLVELDAAAVTDAALWWAVADAAVAGAALAAPDAEPRVEGLAMQLAGLSALVAAPLLAPHTEYGDGDAALMTLGVGLFGAWGALAPDLWLEAPSTAQRFGGGLSGAAIGLAASAALAQLVELDAEDVFETGLLAGAGLAVGLGATRALDLHADHRFALFGASAAALTTTALVAPHTEWSADDRLLAAVLGSAGVWHGLWLPDLRLDDGAPIDGRARAGGAALGLGAGLLTAAALAPFVDVPGSAQAEASLLAIALGAAGGGLGLLRPELGRARTVALLEGAGAAGLALGFALSPVLELSGGDAALVGVSALLGGAMGLSFPALIADAEASGAQSAGGALLGAGGAAAAAVAVAQLVELEPGDVVEAGSYGAAGNLLGFGLASMIPGTAPRDRVLGMNLGGALGLAAGVALAPLTELDAASAPTLGLGLAVGGLAGALSPALYDAARLGDAPGVQIGGGLAAGSALGLGAGLLVDQLLRPGPSARAHAAYGASLGALAGAGIGLTASTEDRWLAGLTGGLSALGALAVGATGSDQTYDGEDLALGSAWVGVIGWHALGLTLLLEGTDRQAAGVALGTVGLGALTGMYLVPHVELSLSDTLMLLAGNVWGTWIGGWGGAVLRDAAFPDLDARRGAGYTLLATVLGSDLGVALTGLVVGELLEVPPTRFAVINLAGLGGMMLGMIGAGFAQDDPLRAGNVVGSLTGLVLGAVVTGFFDWSESPSWDALLSRAERAPAPGAITTAGPSGLGVERWSPTATVQPAEDGTPTWMLGVTGTWH